MKKIFFGLIEVNVIFHSYKRKSNIKRIEKQMRESYYCGDEDTMKSKWSELIDAVSEDCKALAKQSK